MERKSLIILIIVILVLIVFLFPKRCIYWETMMSDYVAVRHGCTCIGKEMTAFPIAPGTEKTSCMGISIPSSCKEVPSNLPISENFTYGTYCP